MYENDYSYLPGLFAWAMAIAALGGSAISLVRPNRTRAGALWAWLSVPILIAVGLGVFAALYGENLERYFPIFFVPVFSAIFLPPWLIAACSAFTFFRYVQAKIAKRKAD